MTKLLTDWVVMATAGDTIDGRKLDAKDLAVIAETYNPKLYNALINYEHLFGNLGEVAEITFGDHPELPGEKALMGKLSPTQELLYFNEGKRGLYLSIEYLPDFRKTGKPYLIGLAVTNDPASVGTSKLQFKRTSGAGGKLDGEKFHCGSPVELKLAGANPLLGHDASYPYLSEAAGSYTGDAQQDVEKSIFKWLGEWFNNGHKAPITMEKDVNKEEIDQALKKFGNELLTGFKEMLSKKEGTQEAGAGQAATEQDNAKIAALEEKFGGLEKKLDKVLEFVAGPVNLDKKDVDGGSDDQVSFSFYPSDEV